ncbi:hypothetical protein ACFXTO_020450 [Malus domestica]
MPFGLTNALATFQCLMNDIFRPYLRKFILVFFDDILVHSSSWSLHLSHLKTIFDTLQQHSLFVKQSKCAFGKSQVEYLGHVVYEKGVAVDPSKLDAISKWPIPTTVKALRGFLGLTGYYKKFIPDLGKIVGPLTALTKKYGFSWSDEATRALNTLKQSMLSPQMLALPNLISLSSLKLMPLVLVLVLCFNRMGGQLPSLARLYVQGIKPCQPMNERCLLLPMPSTNGNPIWWGTTSSYSQITTV